MFNQPSGQNLGKYKLRDLLGSGGMGAVYRAYDDTLSREVAIKVMHLTHTSADFQARFIREAKTAAGLEHSHIVRVYDYGIDHNISYVVMQNLTGGTLSERIRQATEQGRPRASLREIARLLEQLASALDYAHAQGIIHRDIKPQNIMFNNQGQAFIVDFGIAKLLTSITHLTVTNAAIGTPSYMPPEQWSTQELSPAADQYALAVTAYQLAAGELPFVAESVPALWFKIHNEFPTPLNMIRPDAPHPLNAVMGRAMAKNPADRFPDCMTFTQAFASAVSAVPADDVDYFTFQLGKIKPSVALFSPSPPLPDKPTVMLPPPVDSSTLIPSATTPPKFLTSQRWGFFSGAMGALLIFVLLTVGVLGRWEFSTGIAAAQDTLTPSDMPSITSTPPPTFTLKAREAAIATRNADATHTADAWTPTALPDYDATVQAEITALYIEELTATATLWTPTVTRTPTSTWTPTLTLTSTRTLTPTHTLTPTPNLTLTLEAFALAGITANADWQPVEREFDGVTMVLVPVGCFTMGSRTGDADERPAHRQCIDTPFWLDKTEVTQSQFARNGGIKANADNFTGGNRPVEQITWFEARDYCATRGGRLPTEAEWEFAARGSDGLEYPWGDVFVPENLVYGVNSNTQTAEVGSRNAGASWVGALDMAGNVWDWTSSLYQVYPYEATDGRESLETEGNRTVRGGSWLDGMMGVRSAYRVRFAPDVQNYNIGFRCARSHTP